MYFNASIYIAVSDLSVWNRFRNRFNAGFKLHRNAEKNMLSFDYAGDWDCDQGELWGIVSKLSKTLKQDGIVIASTTFCGCGENTSCVYYLGDGVKSANFDEEDRRADMVFQTKVTDVGGWLKYGEFEITEKEKEQLERCRYYEFDGQFIEVPAEIRLPYSIHLEETGTRERLANIANVKKGDPVHLVLTSEADGTERLEVMSEYGSLGFLSDRVFKAVYTAFKNGILQYTAWVYRADQCSENAMSEKAPDVIIELKARTAFPKKDMLEQ